MYPLGMRGDSLPTQTRDAYACLLGTTQEENAECVARRTYEWGGTYMV